MYPTWPSAASQRRLATGAPGDVTRWAEGPSFDALLPREGAALFGSVSGGLYAGHLRAEMPGITAEALQQALERAGIKSNLGWNYALQALEMGSLMAALPD